MDYEQKYKGALERAKELNNRENASILLMGKGLEYIFPELKESEDEQIREHLIRHFQHKTKQEWNGMPVKNIIAWLEKQGEHKPTDKVKPKFKIGDFLVNDYCMGKVIELTNDAYLLDTGQGIPFSCEHNVHLWTIEDAKDGDVLITNKKQPFIFNGHYDEDTDYIYAYCGISDLVKDDSFLPCDEEFKVWCTNENVCPATKEQRDILFSKMREAGCEWDAEKKELKKQKEDRL